MDLVGPIRPASRKNRWILAATEVCTKWVEAVPLKKATGDAVAAFIKENIICRFGIPQTILSDNGTPFINHHVGSLLDEYMVDHRTSSAYYPQGNEQAEATNKTLIRILSKLLDECGGTWADHLPIAPLGLSYFEEKIYPRQPLQLGVWSGNGLARGTKRPLRADDPRGGKLRGRKKGRFRSPRRKKGGSSPRPREVLGICGTLLQQRRGTAGVQGWGVSLEGNRGSNEGSEDAEIHTQMGRALRSN
ncbi:hypothetical protein RHGRI_014244 [Rhododendron griersonianum]|uniref:Integrase catalytic domain-containing protein n=1 Tax=Rhododendron griersonianum TaxID=479676 RepID=A0AAV6K8Y9_9ERIC|nr:hypothetical protein RHGRI_014244 [Rhododendron griersonianum]